MENNTLRTITLHTSAWNWQILAQIYLLFSFLFFSIARNLKTSAFYVAFFLIFIGCEFMSLKRRKEVQNE